MSGHKFDPEQVAEWVRASCTAQGVPVVVSDPEVIRNVTALATGRIAAPADRKPKGEDAGPLPAAS